MNIRASTSCSSTYTSRTRQVAFFFKGHKVQQGFFQGPYSTAFLCRSEVESVPGCTCCTDCLGAHKLHWRFSYVTFLHFQTFAYRCIPRIVLKYLCRWPWKLSLLQCFRVNRSLPTLKMFKHMEQIKWQLRPVLLVTKKTKMMRECVTHL